MLVLQHKIFTHLVRLTEISLKNMHKNHPLVILNAMTAVDYLITGLNDCWFCKRLKAESRKLIV